MASQDYNETVTIKRIKLLCLFDDLQRIVHDLASILAVAVPPETQGTSVECTLIEDLGITQRAYHVLQDHDIKTVAQVATLTEQQLRRFKNCGGKSVKNIREALQEFGLDLKGSSGLPI